MTDELVQLYATTLDTHPYRQAMLTYGREFGLADEKGFETAPHGPLLVPGRNYLGRIQTNMQARHKLHPKDTPLLAKIKVNRTLDAATRKALIPPVTFAQAVVNWALDEVGTHEVPWGSNTGPRVRFYQTFTGAYYSPWCASFVSAALVSNGYTGRVSARAWDWADIGTPVTVENALPGDVVPFNIGDGHVGIFLGYNPSTKMVKTVDGNTSDQVAIRERSISIVRAITRHGR